MRSLAIDRLGQIRF